MKQLKTVLRHMRVKLAFYSMLAFLFALLVQEIPPSTVAAIGFLSFLFLNIGANMFNDYYDKDHSPVIGMEVPVRPTKKVLYGAWILKGLGFVLAVLFLNGFFVSLYVLGVLASYVYSHKSIRAKSNPFLSILFGIASGSAIYLAGAVLGEIRVNVRLAAGLVVSGFFLSSLHIITQIYEIKDDKQRKDSTVAMVYGKRAALVISLIFFIVAGGTTIFIFSLMAVNLFMLLAVGTYFLLIAGLILNWIGKEPESDAKDYHIVKYFIPYSIVVAYVVILMMYFYYLP